MEGSLKLRLLGRGQLVPGTQDLELQGQAVPAPFKSDFGLELDVALTN
jgi:hypothetical protein